MLSRFFFTLLLFSLSIGQLPGQCPDASLTANLVFGFVNERVAVVYNTTEGYGEATWTVEHAKVLRQDAAVLVIELDHPRDSASICLTASTPAGCADRYCVDLFAGAPDDLCQMTDCVWPGDANGSGKANVYDLLHIGLGFGAQGPQRHVHPMPDDPIAWMPTFSDNWSSWIGPVNFKHLDADGNGQVDADDIQAIEKNYSPELDSLAGPRGGGVPVFLQFETDNITIPGPASAEIEFFADLVVGTPDQPVRDLHGIALDLDLPAELLTSGSISLHAGEEALLSGGEAPLLMGMDLREHGMSRFDLAVSRHGQNGVVGSGSVATLRFVINSDIIGGFVAPEIPFELRLNRVLLLDSRGKVIPFALPTPISGPVLVRDLPEEKEAEPASFELSVFPNPAADQVLLDWGLSSEQADLRLFDATGKLVLRRQLSGSTATLPVGRLERGLYLLRLETGEGARTRRLMLR